MAVLADHASDGTLLFSDVEPPGDTDRLLSPITLPSIALDRDRDRGRQREADPGDTPDKARFIGKPFDVRMVHRHLGERLPDDNQPEQPKQAH